MMHTTEIDRNATLGVDPRKGVLTVQEAAETLGVSARTMRRLIASRRIRHLKLGTLVRIRRSDLDAFIARYMVESTL